MSETVVEQVAEQVVQEVAPFVADPKKHAWVTWAIDGDRYVPGALVLADSLTKRGTKASKVVLISSDVSQPARDALSAVFDEVVEVPVIIVETKLSAKEKHLVENNAKILFQKYAFTKLHALNLTQYQKVAVLDADSLCIGQHPDNIFAFTAPAGLCYNAKFENSNKPLSVKFINKNYKQGISGSTYVLAPSTADFNRALKSLARQIKITQVNNQTKVSTGFKHNTSVFANFFDGDDEDEDQEEEEEEPEQQEDEQKETKPNELSEHAPKQSDYKFKIWLNADIAPHGLTIEPAKKTDMGHDERFICDFYLKSWTSLYQGYGFLSWRTVNEKELKKGAEPVIIHFTKCPWEKQEGDWADLKFFYIAAAKAFIDSSNQQLKEYLQKNVVNLDEHVVALNDGSLTTPEFDIAVVQKKEKPEEVITTTDAAEVAPTTEKAPVVVAPIPAKSAWAKK